MTDLVERLREVGRDGVWKSGRNPKTAHPMCIKAADRIEALEAEVKTALHREAETTARYDAKIDALEAEIARKDALMEKVAQAGLFYGRARIDTLSASEIVKEMCGE